MHSSPRALTSINYTYHCRVPKPPLSPSSPFDMSRSAIELTRFTLSAPRAYIYNNAYPRTSLLRNGFSLLPSKTRQPQLRLASSNRSPSSNAYSSASHSLQPSSARSTESPVEKVARLRAARFKARMAQIPLWDRVVVEGRRWADRIHRTTVYILLLFTSMCLSSFAREGFCSND